MEIHTRSELLWGRHVHVTITDDLGNEHDQPIKVTVTAKDDPAVIELIGFHYGLEDGGVIGKLIATDVEGLKDGDYFRLDEEANQQMVRLR